jgi:hypothetical protein
MRQKGSFSRDTYDFTSQKVKDAGGDTSYAGKEKLNSTGKLDPLVDPAEYGVIRRSITRFVEKEDHLILGNGVAMLIETLGDTTGSMNHNVALMFDSLPKLYELLTEGDRSVLGRYDPQILNGFFGDRQDTIPHYQRSQAEMAEKIATQLTLMIPSGDGGGNGGEDPQFGLFAAAYLTKAAINNYGLKSYHFLVTDEISHEFLDKKSLEHVFGSEVFDKVKENTEIAFSAKKLPSMSDIMSKLKSQAHAFAIVLPNMRQDTLGYWTKLYGTEHVVQVNSTEHLPYIQAILIGLTEGVLDLEHIPEYLENHGLSKTVANKIQRSVANIPFGAQTQFENFAKIPEKGSIFANKTDLWPTEEGTPTDGKKSKKRTWL